mmetsp:Transcript_17096/g.25116  ORF Transcript_17096/g.25116 Transcript_17096/m.25116 type:complete len:161 (+) Transcript_17096:122-604(+)
MDSLLMHISFLVFAESASAFVAAPVLHLSPMDVPLLFQACSWRPAGRRWMVRMSMHNAELKVCPLCGRDIPPSLESKHHLVPKLKGGRALENNLVVMHRPCHDKVHAVFTEAQLARDFSTIQLLLANEDIANFAAWIRKRPINFSDGTMSLRRRQQRQRK